AIFAGIDGLRPGSTTVTVIDGQGEGTIALTSGELGTESLQAHRMSLDEMKAARLKLDDPANQNVIRFSVKLTFNVSHRGGPRDPGPQIEGMENGNGFVGTKVKTPDGKEEECL